MGYAGRQALGACPRYGYVTKHLGHPPLGLYPDRRGLDSFPMADDGGVLGNLPNSRPGRRSDKRPASPRAKDDRPPAPAASPDEPEHDPVGDAIRTATGVAATGARVASDIAREIARRLPRP